MKPTEDPTSPRSPLAPYPPYPAQEKSRAPEFYGFVAWTSTYALFVLYILWALLPDAWIEWLGIEWYPSRSVNVTPGFFVLPYSFMGTCKHREWAILLPAYSVILVLLTYFIYWAIALFNQPSFADMRTITGATLSFSLLSCHFSSLPSSRPPR